MRQPKKLVNRFLMKFLSKCCEGAFNLVELNMLKDAYMKSFLCKKISGTIGVDSPRLPITCLCDKY